MNGRLGFLTLASLFGASLLLAGPAPVRADDDHWRFHRKLEQRHEKYHRKSPPYGRALGHNRHHDHDCEAVHGRYSGYDRYGRYDRYDRYGTDARCAPILERAAKARRGLARWEGTGRHRDAVRAWHEILQRTPQRMAECRAQARNDRWSARYDDWYDDDRYYDDGGYYGSALPYGDSFDLKRDWPFLLGGLLGQYGR